MESSAPRNASASVQFSADKMSAHLSLVPAAAGGTRIEESDLLKVIGDAGIVYGLLPEEIARAAAEQHAEQLLIAQGRPAENGENGRLEFLVSRTHVLKAEEVNDESKIVDWHDLGGLTTVEAGAPLVRRHPPGPGMPGSDVLGRHLPPRPGKDVKFGHDLEGAAAADGDPDLLVATCGGLPVFKRDGISVTPILDVKDVDLSVGNIDFKGSVNVKGRIMAGMHVRATGDIIVGEMIEAAIVDSDSNIIVKGGIVGHGISAEHGAGGAAVAHVRAKGELKAHFIENAVVSADSIAVDNEVIQSEVTAAEQVVVGGGKSTHSAIRGGIVRAGMLIRTPVLGAPTSNETVLVVGIDPRLADQVGALNKVIEAKEEEQARLNQRLEALTLQPGKQAVLLKAQHALAAVVEELRQHNEELETLETAFGHARHAKIEVTHSIQGAVRVTLGRRTVSIDEPRGPGTFTLDAETGRIRYD
jgi:hypothetical protein